jgi:hypothetical protein
MDIKVTGTKYEFTVVGQISEHLPLFLYKINNATEIHVDLKGLTFINSIGVSNWVSWTQKIPAGCRLYLENCPFVIINQINIVHGFVPPGTTRVQSFFAPYYCECGKEEILLCERGREYAYPEDHGRAPVALPEFLPCKKCGGRAEMDFDPKKIVKMIQL